MIYSILLQDPPRKNLQLEEMFFVHQMKRRRKKLRIHLKPNLNSIRNFMIQMNVEVLASNLNPKKTIVGKDGRSYQEGMMTVTWMKLQSFPVLVGRRVLFPTRKLHWFHQWLVQKETFDPHPGQS